MLTRKTIQKLRKIVGKEYFTNTREDLLCYSYDGSGRESLPGGVIFPGNTGEVSRIMELAAAAGLAVVPRGAGSGMTGGALPVSGGLVMAMSRFNRIIKIDPENQIAMLEPGVITGEFQEELERRGLFYPPDPASLKFCSIGGNVAECAGGPRAVKYGVTRDYVLGLEAVLPDGRIINTGVQTAKGVAGYDLTRLLVGSEGTLAVITRITLRILARPLSSTIFQLIFRSLEGATSPVSRIIAGMTSSTIEYLDRTALSIIADNLPEPLPAGAQAMLLIELDGDPEVVRHNSGKLKELLSKNPELLSIKEAASPEEAEGLWAARRAISPASFRLRPHKISEDVVVPRTRIPRLVEITEELARRHELTILTFGHAGDGNIHVNIMLDRNDPAEADRAAAAREKLFDEVLKLNGTITGEHGVGITKARFLARELDQPTMEIMRAIKKTFDPDNILNPGKIFLDRPPTGPPREGP